jgi:hypothetical protein
MAPLPESPTTLRLRAAYRCEPCHKHCLVPCRFTAAEFRELERSLVEGRSTDGAS